MPSIILVDNDRAYFNSVKDLLLLSDEGYTIEKYIKHPAKKGDISKGELQSYLHENIDKLELPIVIILDIHFGNLDSEHKLGIEVAKYLMNKNEYINKIKIIGMTNYNNRMYLDDLYTIGVDIFLYKPELEYSLIMALKAAIQNLPFLGNYNPKKNIPQLDNTVKNEVAKMIAKGFSNKSIIEAGYSAAAVQKLVYRNTNHYEIKEVIVGHRTPKENEWNDIWFGS